MAPCFSQGGRPAGGPPRQFSGAPMMAQQNDAKYAALEKALEKSNSAISHAKKSTNPKTWVSHAQTLLDVYGVNVSLLRIGMPVSELKLFFKEPLEIRQVTGENQSYQEYVYPAINVWVDESGVTGWKETRQIIDNPLDQALEALAKATELDTKGAQKNAIQEKYGEIKAAYEKDAFVLYQHGDYKESFGFFEKMVEINQMLNNVDTLGYYYAGLSAFQSQQNAKAKDYLGKAISLKIKEPSVYEIAKEVYMAEGDKDNALKVLKEGMSVLPDDQSLLLNLIQYYLETENTSEALTYLNQAKQRDASNPVFSFVEGTLYDRMGDMAKSLESYQKAISLKPDYYDAYYNTAVLYFNNGVKIMEVANEEKDNVKYEQLRIQADEEFKKCIEPLEKASSIKPEETLPLETLKTIYYRLQMTDQLTEVRKKLGEI